VPYAARFFTSALSTTLALSLTALSAISFRAEWQTLRAQGGITWAAQQNALRPDLAEKALRFVTAELTTVCALPFARAEQWDLLAQAQAQLNENDAAAASYREAMQRAPYDPKLLARAAAFVLDRFPDADAREEARQLAEAALTLSPDLASANLTLAEVFWERYQEEFTKRPEPRTASLEALLAWRKEQFGLLFARIREHAERAAHFAPEPDAEAWELLDQLSLAERGVAYPQARAELAQVEPWKRARWTTLRESVDPAAFGKVLVQAYAEARTQWPPADYLPELALACTEAGAVPGPNLAMDALALRPERWALWGAVLRSNPLGADYVALLEARSEIGPCDEETTRKLAPLFALLDALDARDIAASIKALEGISGLTGLMYDAGMDHLDEEVGWCARITFNAVRAWHLPPEEAAGLLLRIADIASRTGELEFAESLASESAGFLRGVERAGALLLLSEAAVRKGDGSTALTLAQQAAALAPYALPVRWNLALRLSEANRRAEADFEFSGLLPQLNPQTRDGREKLEQYEAFRSAVPPEATP
jgi:cytochrome c-type biogenesis protein CcmH/NrfG